MTPKSRYALYPESAQRTSSGDTYPDVAALAPMKLRTVKLARDYILKENDCDRFDLLCWRVYGSPFYKDLLMMYNNLGSTHELTAGQVIKLPSKVDLDDYFARNKLR
jgi:hypothetical protein